jgi:hypothetical protein
MRAEQIEALAAGFWERAAVPETFPRDLASAIPLALPACIVRLEDLRPVTICRWLLRCGIRLPLDVQDRPLDGCIIAYRNRAAIFVAAGLASDYERAILAHEVGHFLGDYQWPRERAVKRLGSAVLPVLDGERPPSRPEDLAGVLSGIPLGAHVHYMERCFDPCSAARTDKVERTANEVGCELLAPREVVLARAQALSDSLTSWGRLLHDAFGLPEMWAVHHAARLLRRQAQRRTFTDFLGL